MSTMKLVSLVGVITVILGNVTAVLFGFETVTTATQPILLALGVLGIHPVVK